MQHNLPKAGKVKKQLASHCALRISQELCAGCNHKRTAGQRLGVPVNIPVAGTQGSMRKIEKFTLFNMTLEYPYIEGSGVFDAHMHGREHGEQPLPRASERSRPHDIQCKAHSGKQQEAARRAVLHAKEANTCQPNHQHDTLQLSQTCSQTLSTQVDNCRPFEGLTGSQAGGELNPKRNSARKTCQLDSDCEKGAGGWEHALPFVTSTNQRYRQPRTEICLHKKLKCQR